MKRRAENRRQQRQHDRSSSKRRRQVLASLTAAGVAGTGALAQADTSTTLTGLPDTNQAVPINHGSNAEVTLGWSGPTLPETNNDWDQYVNWDGRGDVYQVNNAVADITFTPAAANIKITIGSFELDEYAGGGDTSLMWSVTGSSSGPLASGSWTDKNTANDPTDSGGRSLIGVNATGVSGETLTVVFDHSLSAGFISYLAMDNLTFSTMIIPEPATAVMSWLGVGGLGALAMRRRRN